LGATPEEPAPTLSPEEQAKEVDRQNMRLIRGAIFAYKRVHGHFPEYLSQLAPEFLDAGALVSPERSERAIEEVALNHPDPGNAKPSYAFEFSNLVYRNGRTFEEIKEVQRAEWGDAVPLLRKFGYGKVINMSYGGDLYETELNWEWDPATLDVVAAKGWGPGLQEGKFTTVQVLGPNGLPLANAEVWADGRRYSFDLPNRPFATDENGFVKIPLGTDLDRTALWLRLAGNGLAAPIVSFPLGSPPESYVLKAEPAQPVSGRVVDESGLPLADTWVYLKRAAGNGQAAGGSLGTVKTDAEGRWSANLHPTDAAEFGIGVANGPIGTRGMALQPVNPQQAVAGIAVSTMSRTATPVSAVKAAPAGPR
ncbi:MAG: hypothetical protein WCF18_23920, partial [Chthoniobacteraceae bacterium]